MGPSAMPSRRRSPSSPTSSTVRPVLDFLRYVLDDDRRVRRLGQLLAYVTTWLLLATTAIAGVVLIAQQRPAWAALPIGSGIAAYCWRRWRMRTAVIGPPSGSTVEGDPH